MASDLTVLKNVAPHVGAWIEIKLKKIRIEMLLFVAPHVGAWIEMEK